jgi:hypothetical protein
MSLRNYKCRTFTSFQWTHPVQQTQNVDVPVNLHSHPDLVQPVEHKSSNTPSLIYNILFIKVQCNKMVLLLSGVPVQVSLPSTRVAFSEMWPIKSPHVWNNRTVQLIEERFISLQVSVNKHYFTFISFYQRMHIYCY